MGLKAKVRPQPKPEPELVRLDLGDRIFSFEGERLSGLLEFDLSQERDAFMYERLVKQLDTVKANEIKHVRHLRQEGIMSGAIPPVHRTYDLDNLPPDYPITPKNGPRRISREESSDGE